MPTQTPLAGAGLVTLALSVWSCVAAAQPLTFSKLVDSNATMPDAPNGQKFRNSQAFGTVALSGQRVTFSGANGSPGWGGVYEWNAGTLVRVADWNTPVPQRSGMFIGVGNGDNSGDHVVFGGNNGTIGGLYQRRAGILSVVADGETNAPNGGKFSSAGNPSVEGDSIAFFGQQLVGSNTHPAVYRWDAGTLSTVADTSTVVPGGTGTFTLFDRVRLNQGAASFNAVDSANKAGIYRRNGGGLGVLLDTNSDGPSGTGKFATFGDFGISGDDLIFVGRTTSGDTRNGVFARVNGQLAKVISYGDAAPGGGTFQAALSLSIDGGIAVFYDNSRQAVYTNFGGTLQLVAGPGSVIDGKTVSKVFFGPDGREGNRLAVDVQFTDHIPFSNQFDEAVYLVTLPGPGALAPFAGASILAMRRRR